MLTDKVETNGSLETTGNELSRVAFRAPPFWEGEPELWFHQLESQFVIAGITNDITKYHCVVSTLDTKTLSSVRDLIRKLPEDNPYGKLKARIIELFSQSESVQLKLLLQDLQLGDKRPSQLLVEMQNLSAGKLNDDLLRTLWQQRLPIHIQQILSICKDTLSELALIADKICEVSGYQTVSEVQNSRDSFNLQSLRDEIVALNEKVERLSRRGNRGSKREHLIRRSRSRNSRSRERAPNLPADICWYHKCYGTKAHKCRKPCNYPSEN